jgi:alkylation response protein AidB-like acyl-CoA dehydrogenase
MARLTEVDDPGITAFIVERNFPGFEIGQKFDMLGMRGYATCEIVFSDCKVPKENLLGPHGAGRKVALSSLGKGRVTIAAQSTGWAQGALEGAIAAVKEKPASEISAFYHLIGDLAADVEAGRVLTYQAACKIDRGDQDVIVAAMAKIKATDAAMRVSTEAITIAGISGMDPNKLLERIFRDAKAGQIYEGTNQIQRMLIARSLLK